MSRPGDPAVPLAFIGDPLGPCSMWRAAHAADAARSVNARLFKPIFNELLFFHSFFYSLTAQFDAVRTLDFLCTSPGAGCDAREVGAAQPR